MQTLSLALFSQANSTWQLSASWFNTKLCHHNIGLHVGTLSSIAAHFRRLRKWLNQSPIDNIYSLVVSPIWRHIADICRSLEHSTIHLSFYRLNQHVLLLVNNQVSLSVKCKKPQASRRSKRACLFEKIKIRVNQWTGCLWIAQYTLTPYASSSHIWMSENQSETFFRPNFEVKQKIKNILKWNIDISVFFILKCSRFPVSLQNVAKKRFHFHFWTFIYKTKHIYSVIETEIQFYSVHIMHCALHKSKRNERQLTLCRFDGKCIGHHYSCFHQI